MEHLEAFADAGTQFRLPGFLAAIQRILIERELALNGPAVVIRLITLARRYDVSWRAIILLFCILHYHDLAGGTEGSLLRLRPQTGGRSPAPVSPSVARLLARGATGRGDGAERLPPAQQLKKPPAFRLYYYCVCVCSPLFFSPPARLLSPLAAASSTVPRPHFPLSPIHPARPEPKIYT